MKKDLHKLQIWDETFTKIENVNIGDIVTFPFSGNYILTSKFVPKFLVLKKTNIGVIVRRINFYHLLSYSILNCVNVVGIWILFLLKQIGIGIFRYKTGYAIKSFRFSALVIKRKVMQSKVYKFDVKKYLDSFDEEELLLQFKISTIMSELDNKKSSDLMEFLLSIVDKKHIELSTQQMNKLNIIYSFCFDKS